jgi:hypothetical protein
MADPLNIEQLDALAKRLVQHRNDTAKGRGDPTQLQADLDHAANEIQQRMAAQSGKGVLPNIYQKQWGWLVFLIGVAMFIVFLESASFIHVNHKEHPMTSIIVGAFYVVGVPVIFLLEHLFVFKYKGNSDQYDQFKRVQDLAAKVWAGAIIVLAAIYADQFPK